MAVTLTGAGGLFTILGKVFFAQDTLNTARGTTVPTEVVDVITEFELLTETIDMQNVIDGLSEQTASWRSEDTAMSALTTVASSLVIKMVDDDNPLPNKQLRTALDELVIQMIGAGSPVVPDDDVNASASAATITVGGSNNTDNIFTVSVVRGDGRNFENAFAEDVEVVVTSVSGTASLKGESKARNRLSHDWPLGGGATPTFTAKTSAGSLLANSGFDDEDDRPDTPDDWILETDAGAQPTIGTTVKMSNYEAQTVIISGTPLSGDYTLKFTSTASDEQTTAPLNFNASGSAVQSALRLLDGLGEITVVTTGATPNFTHTITFKNVFPTGDQTTLSSSNTFDTGSIAHAQTIAGTAHVFKGKSVEFDSDGAELTEIKQRLASLSPETSYAWNVWMKVDAFPAAGGITIDLVDGSDTVINDSQSTANMQTVNPQSGGDLSTSAFTAINGYFRTPTIVPDIVYFRIRISTAISSTASLFIDECVFVQATQLYDGGPFVEFFEGTTPLDSSDIWTIVVTNNRAGKFQEHFFRNFGFADFLLPSNTGGTETILDSLIS